MVEQTQICHIVVPKEHSLKIEGVIGVSILVISEGVPVSLGGVVVVQICSLSVLWLRYDTLLSFGYYDNWFVVLLQNSCDFYLFWHLISSSDYIKKY